VRFGNCHVDIGNRRVSVKGGPIPLSYTEWRILERLLSNPDGVALTEETLVRLWGHQFAAETQLLQLFITRLSSKLSGCSGEGKAILPFHGIGYRLAHPPVRA
jgi:two-component system KDP operon response regulator KdpE